MQWVTLGFKLVPLVIAAVQAVERLIKGDKKGAEKHAEVVQMIRDYLAGLEGALVRDLLNDENVAKMVDNLIAAAVALQNAIAAYKGGILPKTDA